MVIDNKILKAYFERGEFQNDKSLPFLLYRLYPENKLFLSMLKAQEPIEGFESEQAELDFNINLNQAILAHVHPDLFMKKSENENPDTPVENLSERIARQRQQLFQFLNGIRKEDH